MPNVKLSEALQQQLRCPVCKATLLVTTKDAICSGPQSRHSFPVVDGVPVLINESNSVFSLDDFAKTRDTTFKLRRGRLESLLHRLLDVLPEISTSIGSK
jgi:uncharacterized protein YbaR (Trm112 family)